MFATEIPQDSIPVQLQPRWLRVPQAVAYSGISRARLYPLLAEGQIRSSSVCAKGCRRGIRLIDRLSLDEFLEKHTAKIKEVSSK
jgi:hypothetical protein